MRGGHAPNIVPDAAYLVADRRLLPGETLASARAEFEQALAEAGIADSVRIASCRLEKPTLSTPADHPAVDGCVRALVPDGGAPSNGPAGARQQPGDRGGPSGDPA